MNGVKTVDEEEARGETAHLGCCGPGGGLPSSDSAAILSIDPQAVLGAPQVARGQGRRLSCRRKSPSVSAILLRPLAVSRPSSHASVRFNAFALRRRVNGVRAT